MTTLFGIRMLKAEYAKAVGLLRTLEAKSLREIECPGEVSILHHPLLRKIEQQHRRVRELEQHLKVVGCDRAIEPLARGEEVLRDARYF